MQIIIGLVVCLFINMFLMLRRIVFAMVFVMFAFNICMAQEMTLAEVRVKIANTQQEYDRFIKMEPKTPEVNDKITMLDQRLADLRRMESKLEDAAISQPVIEKPAEVTPVSTPKASSYSSSKSSSKST